MIIVDSSVWIDSLKGTLNSQTVWLERELGSKRIALTDLILCEILQGNPPPTPPLKASGWNSPISRSSSPPANPRRSIRPQLPPSARRGITVRKTIDCLIATFCMEEGHELLHRDRDFDHFEQHLGLHVLHPKLS